MPSAAQLRTAIESSLARRIPSALTPAPRLVRPVAATGIVALDALLKGGLPVGAVSEIMGQECSGRTGLALAFLAQLTQQEKVCAWVDVSDSLHPESAAAAGVDLDRLLWVRCGDGTEGAAKRPANLPQRVQAQQTARVQLGGNSPHPRSESKGLPSAVSDLLGAKPKHTRDKSIGTPGSPNRPLSVPAQDRALREEQVASDRLPARRGDYVLEQREAYEPRCAEPRHKPRPQSKSIDPVRLAGSRNVEVPQPKRKPWSRLDQALRVTDLLLQAGGFGAIVLDMCSVAPEFASRVPLATWFRYRAAAERTQVSLLLLTQHACAKSSAGLVLRLDAGEPTEKGRTVFAGLTRRAQVTRRRFEQEPEKVMPIRRPPQSASIADWHSRTPWAGRR
jgi:recombination protein RecA